MINILVRYRHPSEICQPITEGGFMKNFKDIKDAVDYWDFNFGNIAIPIFIDNDTSEIIDSDLELGRI